MKYKKSNLLSLAAAIALPLIAMGSGVAFAEDTTPPPTAAEDSANETAKAGNRIISIVLLQKVPRKLSHGDIAHAVEEGAGVEVTEDQVITKEGYHLVPIGEEKYIVTDIAEPYFAEAEQLAAELDDKHLADAVKAAKAWVSVDWPEMDEKADLRKVYQHIGKAIAHLSNGDTLAVYSPDMDTFALWTPETRKALESDDPLRAFAKPDKKE